MIKPAEGSLIVPPTSGLPEEAVLELSGERLVVSRREVQGQTVRIATTTHLREQQVEEELGRETIEIERVAIGRVVEVTPAVREEGDVTIVPVMEEVLVLERRLVLKEEVRIRRIRTTEVHRETVQLRQEVATITRTEADVASADACQPQPVHRTREK